MLRSARPWLMSLALIVGVAMPLACDDANDSCTNLCDGAGHRNAEEEATEDGSVTCSCSTGGSNLSEAACTTYCETLDGEGMTATVEGNSCTCEPAP